MRRTQIASAVGRMLQSASRCALESPFLRDPGLMFRRYDVDSLDNRNEELIDYLYRWFSKAFMKYYRADVRGIDRIPPGPGLYVGNHNASTLAPEAFIFGTAVYERYGIKEAPYGLGHEIAVRFPVAHQALMPLGAIRASHENAHKVFAMGRKVLVYPGGDLDANRPFRHRNRIVFGGRTGYIRLALRENVPIIPVVSCGAHSTFVIIDDMRWLARALRIDRLFRLDVWPLTLSIPWGLTVGPPLLYIPFPTKVLIEVLPPIRFHRCGDEAARDEDYVKRCAEKVETVMQATLDHLARERRNAGS